MIDSNGPNSAQTNNARHSIAKSTAAQPSFEQLAAGSYVNTDSYVGASTDIESKKNGIAN